MCRRTPPSHSRRSAGVSEQRPNRGSHSRRIVVAEMTLTPPAARPVPRRAPVVVGLGPLFLFFRDGAPPSSVGDAIAAIGPPRSEQRSMVMRAHRRRSRSNTTSSGARRSLRRRVFGLHRVRIAMRRLRHLAPRRCHSSVGPTCAVGTLHCLGWGIIGPRPLLSRTCSPKSQACYGGVP